LAAFTSLVIALVRYVSYRRLRIKLQAVEQQAALDKERVRIARDLHDDLGNLLTKITLMTGSTGTNGVVSDERARQTQEISKTARRATDALDEIVWAINPRNDTLPNLINYLGYYCGEFLHMAGVRCRMDLPDSPPDIPVPADVRHNLCLAMKEAITNIVRHARADEVWLRITADEEFITVTIEDNGRGFASSSKEANADGLPNMRQRMDDIGGKLEIESHPGNGTRISFVCPRHAKNRMRTV